ncbi:DUF5000 domain-containing lipoprotein [Chitinophaga alhagiae]|uniref:DUF5000 domain-containing lipoprotein n=1 Tax=Chitinophaga alhagiae TaxID=2203219 RepID=UPI000E5A4296|nr:DUF5000 domain-containing lipoprotein [Chitinophaga alhagiae]
MQKYSLIICTFLLVALGCKEEKLGPLTKGGNAPGQVSNVTVENLPGRATLRYSIPSDPDLLYIKAVYETRPGKTMEVISSFYNNSMTLEGFGNTEEREVQLYSVSKTEAASTPVTVKVKPLTPPVQAAFASLAFEPDFGGIRATFVNEDSANIVIGVLTRDPQGEPLPADMHYTSQKAGAFFVRGFDDTPRWFGLYVRDRWQNHSDTVWKQVTPLFEEKLDKKLFKGMSLPTDAKAWGSVQLQNLWNDVVSGGQSSSTTWFRTQNGSGVPHHITFDLGVTARISRIIQVPRGAFDEKTLLYSAGDPQLYEIWGSNSPATDGSFNGWTKLQDCEVVKVSGLPIGINSDEDISRAQAGHEFMIPADAPPVRYIRIKMLQTFGNADYFWMAELTFFGEIQ